MRYLIDSYAWIEYLDGTESGKKVKDILNKNNEIFTLSLNIAEVISRMKRKEGNIEDGYDVIISNANILELSPEIAKEAGLIHAEIKKRIRDFGLIDAFVLVTARKLKAKILTGDEHFRGFKEAVLIK